MGPRWKKEDSEAIAAAKPMSKIVSALQSSLITQNCKGRFAGRSVLLLEADSNLFVLLYRACFVDEEDKPPYQLGLEEAFYLCYTLKCLKIVDHDGVVKSDAEVWCYMCSEVPRFPELFKAYSHLRAKNWVVTRGVSRYGVDFVAYRHHPALIHAEYSVLFLSNRNNERMSQWSDIFNTLRLCGSVAKTLLVLHVEDKGGETDFPVCLNHCEIKE